MGELGAQLNILPIVLVLKDTEILSLGLSFSEVCYQV